MPTLIAQRLQKFNATGAMGLVTDTTYIRCFWPHLEVPTALFADGSSGIQVMGPPTPRNVVFPEGTVFLDYVPDAASYARGQVIKAVPAGRKLINLSTGVQGHPDLDLVQLYLDAYAAKVADLPDTATRVPTQTVFLLRERPDNLDEFKAPITFREAKDIVEGRESDAAMRARKRSEFKRRVKDEDGNRTVETLPARGRG